MPYRPSDITLYIPCYNADRSVLREALSMVAGQTARPAAVLLVDDGSTPPLGPDIFADIDLPTPEISRHAANLGLSAARNTALAACRTPLIAALDADVIPSPTWLEMALAAMNAYDVVGVGGRMLERCQETLGDRFRAAHMAQHWGVSPLDNPRFLFGADTLFRADILREVGGYVAAYRTNYEDVALSEALFARGHRLRYEPAALCHHARKDTGLSILPGYWRWHHYKGVARGDFDTEAGLIGRIDAVNFGVFRYRFDLDSREGREELLPLDLLLPWVFGALDWRLALSRGVRGAPTFPPALPLGAPEKLEKLLTRFVPRTVGETGATAYLERFADVLAASGWMTTRSCPLDALDALYRETFPSSSRSVS